ncbi:MAG: NAD(P)-binding protein [Proteobacteria bacterium]|nr:NAD(P)-binding protein [Pseudomonadota bacterium]
MSAGATQYPYLFTPLQIGPLRLKNRALMSAHGMGLGDGVVGVSDRYRAYLVTRAAGGAAMVGIESSPVHPTTVSRSLVVRLDRDSVIPSLARLADEVHAVDSKLAITLWHGGHKDTALRMPYTVAPSPIPNMMGEVPRELTKREIADIVRGYGAAAKRCRTAGLDCLEVQTATDYLLGSFLSPALNHRLDEYGGALENRARIVVEVLEAVRAAAGPGIAVGVRTSACHAIPNAPIDYTTEESIAAMSLLAERGLVDYVSIMAGSAWAEGASIPTVDYPRAPLASVAARFKQALQVPVFVTGRIRTAAEAESILANKQADALAMARTWIAEPGWLNKIAARREAEIRPCFSCNQGCVGHVFRGIPGTCVINPRAGNEHLLRLPQRRDRAATVAVIGAGPAGLETARLAAENGFAVTLYEAGDQIGGQWRLAASVPQRAELGLAIDWWQAELSRLGVTIRLNTQVELDEPPATTHVIWAIGAASAQTAVWRFRPWLRGGIPGGERCVQARDVLAGTAAVRGHVAVIDEEGGWPSLTLVAKLLATPTVSKVTVLTTERSWGTSATATTFEASVLHALLQSGQDRLHVKSGFIVQSIDLNNNKYSFNGGTSSEFELVILSTGTAARAVPEDALAVGDCVAPRGLWAATSDAARVVAALVDNVAA